MIATDYFDEANQDVLRPIACNAATRNGLLVAPMFRTSDFLESVRDGFGTKARQSLEWGRQVLSNLDYVATAGGPDQWIYLGTYIINGSAE